MIQNRRNTKEGEVVEQFSYAKIETAFKKCANGNVPGIDGVANKDIRLHWEECGYNIVSMDIDIKVFNLVLVNQKNQLHGNSPLSNEIQSKTLIEVICRL